MPIQCGRVDSSPGNNGEVDAERKRERHVKSGVFIVINVSRLFHDVEHINLTATTVPP